MNNILLENLNNGCFDWSFKGGDLEDVKGDQSLISAVIHSTLTRPAELEQAAYTGAGCNAHKYINAPDTPETLRIIEKEVETECNKLNNVNQCEVKATISNEQIILKIKVFKDDGGVLYIGI